MQRRMRDVCGQQALYLPKPDGYSIDSGCVGCICNYCCLTVGNLRTCKKAIKGMYSYWCKILLKLFLIPIFSKAAKTVNLGTMQNLLYPPKNPCTVPLNKIKCLSPLQNKCKWRLSIILEEWREKGALDNISIVLYRVQQSEVPLIVYVTESGSLRYIFIIYATEFCCLLCSFVLQKYVGAPICSPPKTLKNLRACWNGKKVSVLSPIACTAPVERYLISDNDEH